MRTVPKALVLALAIGLTVSLASCATSPPTVTRHRIMTADLGQPSRTSDMVASLSRPGTVVFARHAFGHFAEDFVDRKDPRAAGQPASKDQATIYAFVLDHPVRGRILIDSGVSEALMPKLTPIMRGALEQLEVRITQPTAQWQQGQPPPRAVFLTHIHLDHVGGLHDLPASTPVYLGRGEARHPSPTDEVLGFPIDTSLTGKGPLREWRFTPDPDGLFDGVIDIFGDGSIWAISVPGHSAGSVAYLVNAVDGPKLVIGDAISTKRAWDTDLPEPAQVRAATDSAANRLKHFARTHPRVEVFLGHQDRH